MWEKPLISPVDASEFAIRRTIKQIYTTGNNRVIEFFQKEAEYFIEKLHR